MQNESRLAHFTKFSYNGSQGHGDAGRGTAVQDAAPQSFPGPTARPGERLTARRKRWLSDLNCYRRNGRTNDRIEMDAAR
ncbi:hypothetical protein CLOSTASPAR_05363 [[Clostridium] asparagiforme DSM 15981]|uniref:Uncharacterized protein n=1 Tax=[Clostridium] asparagiforme DSM 15981 TaxID=518636 RepID=C0D7W6_9FIRM|nr:hypothetical protein CLOSTASPAR_05363 [[Clostridium] asparagiforme DSM 15981]